MTKGNQETEKGRKEGFSISPNEKFKDGMIPYTIYYLLLCACAYIAVLVVTYLRERESETGLFVFAEKAVNGL